VKILGNYWIYRGVIEGGKSPLAEKWVFISQRLIFRVGGKIRNNLYFKIIRQSNSHFL
jgi:hypothetical protein